MNKILEIFKQFKTELVWIYFFMLITELSILATPLLLGKSIDGLINGNWYWLIFLGLSYFISNFFNYKRMVYDTKVYTKIYNSIVFRFLKKVSWKLVFGYNTKPISKQSIVKIENSEMGRFPQICRIGSANPWKITFSGRRPVFIVDRMFSLISMIRRFPVLFSNLPN